MPICFSLLLFFIFFIAAVVADISDICGKIFPRFKIKDWSQVLNVLGEKKIKQALGQVSYSGGISLYTFFKSSPEDLALACELHRPQDRESQVPPQENTPKSAPLQQKLLRVLEQTKPQGKRRKKRLRSKMQQPEPSGW